jgi:16S rRNA (cytosine1402-N4)-methyltransferase
VLGIERDPAMAELLPASMSGEPGAERFALANADFRNLGEILAARGIDAVDGVLFDLGLSSYHLDRGERGFSFARDEPLDMRFDPASGAPNAADLLRDEEVRELTRIFGELGEERFASRIARTVAARRRERPIATTAELLAAVERSLPPAVRWRAARHAARVFQGLRIAVNDELGAIREALPQAARALRPSGRLVVISFHSLEDRIVKHFFRNQERDGDLRILTKKPIQPDEREIAANSRAASAKLRAAEKI